MSVNYVRFQRGSQEAYDALKSAGRLDENTLYFIYNTDDSSVGALYMGTRIISGGDITIASARLDDLADVIVNGANANSFLVKNENDKWIAKTLEDVIGLIKSGLNIDNDLNTLIQNIENLQQQIEEKADKATTLEGYGITNTYTKDETNQKIEDALKAVTGGESAADVKIALDNYKEFNDSRVGSIEQELEKLQGTEPNFITAVNESIFSVNNGTLGLVAIPATALSVLGDLNNLPNANEGYTLVDEINKINEILTWTSMV